MKIVLIAITACLVGTNVFAAKQCAVMQKAKGVGVEYKDTADYISLRLERIERMMGLSSELPQADDVDKAISNIVMVAKKYEVGFSREKIEDTNIILPNKYDEEIGSIGDSFQVLKNAGLILDIHKHCVSEDIVYKDPKELIEYINTTLILTKPITAPLPNLRMTKQIYGF